MPKATRRLLGLVTPVVLLMAVFGVGAIWLAERALAEDSYDSLAVSYVVSPEGVLSVTETHVFRFGPDSGRQGIERLLVVREPYDDESDVTYDISNITVTSSDGISTDWTTYEVTNSPREVATVIQIGSADTTIEGETATYVLSYDVRGALRSPEGFPELYWDVTRGSLPAIRSAYVEVQVPGGAQEVVCSTGAPGTETDCESATVESGVARFSEGEILAQDLLTIAVRLESGAVADADLQIVPRADTAEMTQTGILQAVGAAMAVGIPLVGWWYWRRRGRDRRYAGLTPGTIPDEGEAIASEPHNPRTKIPMISDPPELPLSHAGFLLEGRYRVNHLTATVMALATSGAIQLRNEQGGRADSQDPGRIPDEQSDHVYKALFAGGRSAVTLSKATSLSKASVWLAADARKVAAGGWFTRIASGKALAIGLAVLLGLAVAVMFAPVLAWLWVPMVIAAVATMMVLRRKLARGQRTPLGRAWTDRVEGFRRYLATADVDQLRREEGDLFSKYLPWAVLFGLTDRWTAVCSRAVEAGRLPAPDTMWFGGAAGDDQSVILTVGNVNDSVLTATSRTRGSGRSRSIGSGGSAASRRGGGSVGSRRGSARRGSPSGGGGLSQPVTKPQQPRAARRRPSGRRRRPGSR